MKSNLQRPNTLLFAVILFPAAFVLNNSCINNRIPKNADSASKSKFENVIVQGSGLDSIKLSEIPITIQQFIEKKKIAGAVTLVAHNGQVVSYEAVGFQNIEKNIPMQKNTIFRIASMTKPFVGAAIMMLVEEGKLQLDDPVEKYLSGFRNMWLVSEMTESKAILVRPNRKITIRDILTHTHGLAALPAGIPIKAISEYTLVISQLPLQFEPGSQWRYGGSGITTAARIVEVISEKPYEEFLSERIFTPLGMEYTSFSVKKEYLDRLTALYQPSADSSDLVAVEPPDWSMYPRPDGGLYSTAMDYAKWMQAMLNGGIFNGNRILTKESVNELTKIQTGELNAGFTDGMSFGLTFGIVRDPSGVTAMLSPGTFGHGGAFGTQAWADPKNKTVYILMIQRTGFGNGDASDIRNSFQKITAEAIVK